MIIKISEETVDLNPILHIYTHYDDFKYKSNKIMGWNGFMGKISGPHGFDYS